jgi:hypothetical protein
VALNRSSDNLIHTEIGSRENKGIKMISGALSGETRRVQNRSIRREHSTVNLRQFRFLNNPIDFRGEKKRGIVQAQRQAGQ